MKFKFNPNRPSADMLIKEVEMLIKGAEVKYAAMVAEGKMTEVVAQYKWNVLKHLQDMVREHAAGGKVTQGDMFTSAPPVADTDFSKEPDQPKLEPIAHTALDQYEEAVKINPAVEGLRDKLDMDLNY